MLRTMPVIIVTASLAACAFADVYTDRAAFDAANPGLPLMDFEGLAPASDFVAVPDYSAQGVTFSDQLGFTDNVIVMDSGFLGTPTDVLCQSDYEQPLLITFDPAVQAVGFDVAIGDYSGLNDTGVIIEAFDGATSLASASFDTADPTLFSSFRGFSNLGAGITSIMISATSPGDYDLKMIDNFSHGVPEPGTLALLGCGAWFALRRRTRRESPDIR